MTYLTIFLIFGSELENSETIRINQTANPQEIAPEPGVFSPEEVKKLEQIRRLSQSLNDSQRNKQLERRKSSLSSIEDPNEKAFQEKIISLLEQTKKGK